MRTGFAAKRTDRQARPPRFTIVSSGGRPPWPLALGGLLLAAFLVLPNLSLLSSLHGAATASPFRSEALDALRVTVVAAGAAVLIVAALGVPLALWMATSRSPLRHVVTVAVLLPLAVPPVVGGLELVLWLGPYGWLGSFLGRIGLNPLDTLAGTILAQVFVAAPFVILPARAAFAAVDPVTIDAARTLGCSPLQTFIRVMLPSARRGIIAGLVLGWLRATGEFGASVIVSYHPFTLANLTFAHLSGRGIRAALPAGVLLAGFGVVTAALLLLLDAPRWRSHKRGQSAETTTDSDLAWLRSWQQRGASTTAGSHHLKVRALGRLGEFTLDIGFETWTGAVAILGRSGAGKSLTLRTIAGLLRPETATVALGGRVLRDAGTGIDLPVERRQLGYVGQRDALFEFLDVAGNVGFGLRAMPAAQRRQRVADVLAVVGLSGFEHALPRTLSGGERQRVALARALAPGPAALLLDEPFASLDLPLRARLRSLVRRLHEQTGLPVVLVTHDREDALALADHVVVMDGGRVVQQGGIEEVYARPASRTVAALAGIPNVVPIAAVRAQEGGGATGTTAWCEVQLASEPAPGSRWELAVPAEAIMLHWEGTTGTVASARPSGEFWKLQIAHREGGQSLEVLVCRRDSAMRPQAGTPCSVTVDASRCQLMACPPTASADLATRSPDSAPQANARA